MQALHLSCTTVHTLAENAAMAGGGAHQRGVTVEAAGVFNSEEEHRRRAGVLTDPEQARRLWRKRSRLSSGCGTPTALHRQPTPDIARFGRFQRRYPLYFIDPVGIPKEQLGPPRGRDCQDCVNTEVSLAAAGARRAGKTARLPDAACGRPEAMVASAEFLELTT